MNYCSLSCTCTCCIVWLWGIDWASVQHDQHLAALMMLGFSWIINELLCPCYTMMNTFLYIGFRSPFSKPISPYLIMHKLQAENSGWMKLLASQVLILLSSWSNWVLLWLSYMFEYNHTIHVDYWHYICVKIIVLYI